MTAFVKSGEARCGSFAIQYRYAAGSPRPANIATTGGHRTTTSRSPRPAGPNALAPIRLETTVERMIVTSVMMISLALRAITIYSILRAWNCDRLLSLRHAPGRWPGWCAAESKRQAPATSGRCIPDRAASIVRTKDCCDLKLATDKL